MSLHCPACGADSTEWRNTAPTGSEETWVGAHFTRRFADCRGEGKSAVDQPLPDTEGTPA